MRQTLPRVRDWRQRMRIREGSRPIVRRNALRVCRLASAADIRRGAVGGVGKTPAHPSPTQLLIGASSCERPSGHRSSMAVDATLLSVRVS